MRRILALIRHFLLVFLAISAGLLILLWLVFGLPFLIAFVITAAMAGSISWFALDLLTLPGELEQGRQRSVEDDGRRSFLDEIRRQGPGWRRKQS